MRSSSAWWLARRVALSLLTGGLLVTAAPVAADGASVVVEVEGLRSARGRVRGALFDSSRGWTEEGRQIATCEGEIERGRATCVMGELPAGDYAFAFLHDEDDDGELDRNFIGLPDEGYGFSNDASPGLGPPSFDSARFHHAGTTHLTVHARYGL